MISVSASHNFKWLKCGFKGIITAPQTDAVGKKKAGQIMQKIKVTKVFSLPRF